MSDAPISIEVTVPGGGKSYLPTGATLRAIHAVTGDPLDLNVALDRGEITTHGAEAATQGATP